MRVTVTVPVTVNIDPDAWATDFGIEGAAAIRADVKVYVVNTVTAHLRDLGYLT